MILSPTTLLQYLVPMPAQAGAGIILPEPFDQIILDHRGRSRVVFAKDRSDRVLTPRRFSTLAGSFWNDLDQITQKLLADDILNPRSILDNGGLSQRDHLCLHEQRRDIGAQVRNVFSEQMTKRGVTLEFQDVFESRNTPHFYFIPVPDVSAPFLTQTGNPVCKDFLKEIILRGLLDRGLISAQQALLALNAYVSAFPLTTVELTLLTGINFFQKDVEKALLECQAMLLQSGFVFQVPQPETVVPVEMQPEKKDPHVSAPTGNYRELFETTLRHLTEGERVTRARQATTVDELSAFCLDSSARVIQAVFANTHVGARQAQLVATYHKTTAGLDFLFARHDFMALPQVQSALLKNNMVQAPRLRNMIMGMDIGKIGTIITSNNVTSQARMVASQCYRDKFLGLTPAQKVQVIMRTHGRCLQHVKGQRLDAQTVRLLKQQPRFSADHLRFLQGFPGVTGDLIGHIQGHLQGEGSRGKTAG